MSTIPDPPHPDDKIWEEPWAGWVEWLSTLTDEQIVEFTILTYRESGRRFPETRKYREWLEKQPDESEVRTVLQAHADAMEVRVTGKRQ